MLLRDVLQSRNVSLILSSRKYDCLPLQVDETLAPNGAAGTDAFGQALERVVDASSARRENVPVIGLTILEHGLSTALGAVLRVVDGAGEVACGSAKEVTS